MSTLAGGGPFLSLPGTEKWIATMAMIASGTFTQNKPRHEPNATASTTP
jgi:hypothetical protein